MRIRRAAPAFPAAAARSALGGLIVLTIAGCMPRGQPAVAPQAPGGPEEDRSDGFAFGGWTAPFVDEPGLDVKAAEVSGPA